MRFSLALITAALAALAAASPTELGAKRQSGDCIEVFFPDTCPADHPLLCDGAGAIQICCTSAGCA
ncbi:hypothetical protein C8R43DRAFT_1244098 [Mycena crocata]|nr:hypothetical protein C8R43DRAFT_1244098 [Mycena crocata]